MEGFEQCECEQNWRGSPLKEVYRHLDKFDLPHFAPVRVSKQSTVLYDFPIGVVDGNNPPKPHLQESKFDSLHVRLPNYVMECQCPKGNASRSKVVQPDNYWNLIKDALSDPINTVYELREAILVYQPDFKEHWHFQALDTLLQDELEVEAAEEFFKNLLPRIIRLALQLPDLIQAPIPLLKQKTNHSISLTQQQVSCLLANAFLCTFPHRSSVKHWQPKHAEYKSFSDINFHKLYQSFGSPTTEKLKCLLNYFNRVCPTETDGANVPTGVVTFIRQSLSPETFPDWSTCRAAVGETILHVDAAGVIEDGVGLLQVDFANKYVGGGVLGFGCVQEEIRFVLNPELIVAKLFTEFLLPNEALFMIGCEQYNSYSGYGSSFKWAGDHIDKTPRDNSKRRQVHIVAIDATFFREQEDQYREYSMLRELNKAFVGFLHQLPTPAPGIATGNWGCGAFRGDPRLKALLQLMVACVTDRPLVYYTHFDATLRDEVYEMHRFLKKRKIRVCDLWLILQEFGPHNLDSKDLYRYIKCRLRKQI